MVALTVESIRMAVKRLFVVHEVSMVKRKLSEAGLPLVHYMDEHCTRNVVQASVVIQEQSCSKNVATRFKAVMLQQRRALLWQ